MEQPYSIWSKLFNSIFLKIYFAFQLSKNNLSSLHINYIKSTKLNWPLDNKKKKFYHTSISVKFSNAKEPSTFSGLDFSLARSAIKCFSELCEGFFLQEKNQDTFSHRSGISCHLTINKAVEKSYLELIERDSFLMHFLCPSLSSKFLNSYHLNHCELTITELQSIDKRIRVLCAFLKNNKEGYFYIGLSSDWKSNNFKSLMNRAIFESLMLFNGFPFPKYSNVKPNSKQSLLLSHLQATKEKMKNLQLQKIAYGGGNIKLKFYTSMKLLKIEKKIKFVNRHVVYCTHPKIIELEFGQKWLSRKNYYEMKLISRNLKLEHWGLHPLL